MYEDRRIIICIPSAEKADVQFYENILKLITNHGLGNTTVGISFAVSSRIVGNRNTLVQKAREANATDMLFIDSDTIFPTGALRQLIEHDKDIVCATTCKRDGISYDVFCHPLDSADVGSGKAMIKAKTVGFPFMLIKMSVFDKLQKPYFAEPPYAMVGAEGSDADAMPEDEFFCYMARKAGFDVWVDLKLSADTYHVGRFVFKPNKTEEKPQLIRKIEKVA